MNKLTALYSVMNQMKSMKSRESFKAHIEGHVTFDQDSIAEGTMSLFKEQGRVEKKVSLKLAEEEINFEHKGHSHSGQRPHMDKCCGHGHRHSHMHRHGQNMGYEQPFEMGGPKYHGHRHGGGFTRAMTFIKLLDLMTFEKVSEEKSVLALNLKPADLPEDLRQKMERHLNYKKEMLKHLDCEDCEKYGDWLKASGLETLNKDSLEMVSIDLKLTMDKDSNPVEFIADHLWQGKTEEGILKPIRFKVSANLL